MNAVIIDSRGWALGLILAQLNVCNDLLDDRSRVGTTLESGTKSIADRRSLRLKTECGLYGDSSALWFFAPLKSSEMLFRGDPFVLPFDNVARLLRYAQLRRYRWLYFRDWFEVSRFSILKSRVLSVVKLDTKYNCIDRS